MHLDELRRDVALAEANLINRRSLALADGNRLAAAARAAATPLRIGIGGVSLGYLIGRGGTRSAVGNQTLAAALSSTFGLVGALVQQVTRKRKGAPAHTAAGAIETELETELESG